MKWCSMLFLVLFHTMFFINPCYASGEGASVTESILVSVPLFLWVVMFFISHLTAMILLVFGLVGANKWRINQEKLYIADDKKSKADKLVLIIISLPIVIVFLMFLSARFFRN